MTYGTIYWIANILENTMIDTLILGSKEALFIKLRINLKWSQGD